MVPSCVLKEHVVATAEITLTPSEVKGGVGQVGGPGFVTLPIQFTSLPVYIAVSQIAC